MRTADSGCGSKALAASAPSSGSGTPSFSGSRRRRASRSSASRAGSTEFENLPADKKCPYFESLARRERSKAAALR
jgi:hypothetical protein